MGTARRFTKPEGNRRRLPVRILHAYFPLLDAEDTPGSVAQLKNIALQTLDSEVFIHRAYDQTAWLEYNSIISGIGNRATGSNCCEAGAAAASQTMIHGVVVQISRAPPTLRGKTFRQHADN